MKFIKQALISFCIIGICLCLIAGIGVGEAYRTHSSLKVEGVYALGNTIKSVVDSFLGAGVSLRQFTGFDRVSAMILESDSSISGMGIVDNSGAPIFSCGQKPWEIKEAWPGSPDPRFFLDETQDYFRLTIPLAGKIEQAGSLQLVVQKTSIRQKTMAVFKLVFVLVAFLSLLFPVQIYLVKRIKIQHPKLWISICYSISTLLVTLLVGFSLIRIYNHAIEEKTQNLTNSLTHKLSYVKKLGLDMERFTGIDRLLGAYRELNPEISLIELKENHRRIARAVTGDLKNQNGYVRHTQAFKDLNITVWVDKTFVYKKMWTSSKNFLILLVASFFMSALFLNLMFTFTRAKPREQPMSTGEKEKNLALIKPVFFLGVFIEGLFASFLPQYFESLTQGNGSFLFTLFFISYGIVLVPAAAHCQKHGEKPMLVWSVTFIGITSLAMAFSTNLTLMSLVRLAAGICQGTLFMAVQSYILKSSPVGKKTQSMAILIIQYNGGRIAGTALGALAVNYLAPSGVFVVGAFLSVFLIAYAIWFVPRLDPVKTEPVPPGQAKPEPAPSDQAKPEPGFMTNVKVVFKDMEHLKTSFLVGVNAKLVMIGVISFSLPLIMERRGFNSEDIGFMLMLYSAGVLVSSLYSSRLADITGNTKKILFRGNQGSGLGLCLMGLMGLPALSIAWSGAVLSMGTLILGLAHGFIAAPITTHISGTKTAAILGAGPSISVFRLFERAGNILGPIILGQLLMIHQYNPGVIGGIGGVILVCGFLFRIQSVSSKAATMALIFLALSGRMDTGLCQGPDWFQFTREMPQNWQMIVNPDAPQQFILSPKSEQGEFGDKKILILIPKPSSAYITSTESILSFFRDKHLFPKFKIVNFNKDKAQGQQALKSAREEGTSLIFAMGSLSADFVFHHFKSPDIPVVTVCAKDPVMMGYVSDYTKGGQPLFAFTSINIPVRLQMAYFKELIPGLKNIGILYARKNTSAVKTQVAPLRAHGRQIDIQMIDVVVENQKNARAELAEKIPAAVARMAQTDETLTNSLFWVTGSTSVFSHFDLINRHAGNIPVIGASPSMVKDKDQSGAAMAIGVGFENNARQAALYAEKILKGKTRPEDLPVGVITPPDIAVNFKQIRKINMKIPFNFFELANLVINDQGKKVKSKGSILIIE